MCKCTLIQIRNLIDLSTSCTLGNSLVSTGFQNQLACFRLTFVAKVTPFISSCAVRKSTCSCDKTSAKYQIVWFSYLIPSSYSNRRKGDAQQAQLLPKAPGYEGKPEHYRVLYFFSFFFFIFLHFFFFIF